MKIGHFRSIELDWTDCWLGGRKIKTVDPTRIHTRTYRREPPPVEERGGDDDGAVKQRALEQLASGARAAHAPDGGLVLFVCVAVC